MGNDGSQGRREKFQLVKVRFKCEEGLMRAAYLKEIKKEKQGTTRKHS